MSFSVSRAALARSRLGVFGITVPVHFRAGQGPAATVVVVVALAAALAVELAGPGGWDGGGTRPAAPTTTAAPAPSQTAPVVDVRGLDRAEALDALSAAGFRPTVDEVCGAALAPGRVVAVVGVQDRARYALVDETGVTRAGQQWRVVAPVIVEVASAVC